ncbi:MAG: putative toxin-antitoxin system toxin component, PIN family [Pyrinomonadaceae bacterium]
MNTTAPRVVLDTNILVACIGKKSPFRWVFDCVIQGNAVLCISNDILLEYREVIARKTSEHVAENIVNFLTISPFVDKIEIYFNFDLIATDSSDNKFVDCSIAANADCLVSNDRHFQILKTFDFPKVTVLNLSEFEDRYGSEFQELT